LYLFLGYRYLMAASEAWRQAGNAVVEDVEALKVDRTNTAIGIVILGPPIAAAYSHMLNTEYPQMASSERTRMVAKKVAPPSMMMYSHSASAMLKSQRDLTTNSQMAGAVEEATFLMLGG
jgi:hypothetical protein